MESASDSAARQYPMDFNIIDDEYDKRLQLRYCTYDCGRCLCEQQLLEHKEICSNRPQQYKCMICQNVIMKGQWNRIGEDFMAHMHDQHHHKVVYLNESDDWEVRLDADDTAKLLSVYSKNYIKNDLYWIQQINEDGARCVRVQHFFSTEEDCKLKKFEVKCKDSKFIFQAYVIPREASSTDISLNTLDVTQLSPSKSSLLVKIFRRVNIPKTVMRGLECIVCKDFMRTQVKLCSTGHSICDVCSKKLRECPLCKSLISSQRNFIVESLIATLDSVCINNVNGCLDEFLPEERTTHELNCGYQLVKCFKCDGNFSIVHLYTHLVSQCKSLTPIFSMNSLITLDDKIDVYICSAFGQQFSLNFKKFPDGTKMALRHIIPNSLDAFYYEIRLWTFTDSVYKQRVYIDRCETINDVFPIVVEGVTHIKIRVFKYL